jgi:hypothetical protein
VHAVNCTLLIVILYSSSYSYVLITILILIRILITILILIRILILHSLFYCITSIHASFLYTHHFYTRITPGGGRSGQEAACVPTAAAGVQLVARDGQEGNQRAFQGTVY